MPLELPAGTHITYNRQYRRCARPNCPSCGAHGPGHGPYWYAYWREDGRLRSRYVGKHDPRTVGEARAADDAVLAPARPAPSVPPSGLAVETDQAAGTIPAEQPPGSAGSSLPAESKQRAPVGHRRVRSVVASGPGGAGSRALPALRVRTLGGFQVWRGEEPIADAAWSRRKAAALFKCLLDAPGHRLAREQIIEMLWPDAPPGDAANTLKVTLHHLRRILDVPGAAHSYIRVEAESLMLAPIPGLAHDVARGDHAQLSMWWDALAFARAAASALAGREIAACRAAVALYGGAYLPDDRYADWASSRRETLHDTHLALLAHLASLHSEAGEMEPAIAHLQTVLTADPCREESARLLMQVYAAASRPAEAARVYRALAGALDRELGLTPDAATRALYQRILAARRVTQAAAPASAPPRVAAPLVQPPLAFEGAGATGPFVGRGPFLAGLDAALQSALAGKGDLMLLAGGAGVGKSRLALEFARHAVKAGAIVLVGCAYLPEGGLPYGPLLEALRGYARMQSAALLTRQCGQAGGALLAVLPELAAALPDLPRPVALEPLAEQHRLLASLAGLLREIAQAQPVVLVLDDLHWADATTVQALHYLRRTCRDLPLLLLGAYRPEELDAQHPLAHLTADLRREHPRALISLPPLDETGCADLTAALLGEPATLDDDLAALVWQKSRGNPFFTGELIAALRAAGALFATEGRWRLRADASVAAPVGVRSLIAERLERLDPAAANLLRLGAVLGKDMHHAVLRHLSDLHEDRLLEALDVAVEAGLLVEQGQDGQRTGEEPSYSFTHPMIPEALYQSMPPGRRALLHGRAGEALEALDGARRAADLAWHFAHAGRHGPAARYALLAADQAAAAHAAPEALSHLLAARAHLGEIAAPAHEIARLDERLGDLRLLLGEYAAAQQNFAEARAVEPDPARRAELARKEGVTWERRGALDRALAHFDRAEVELITCRPGDAGEAAAAIALSRGEALYRRGDYPSAEASAHRALALLRHPNPGPPEAAATRWLAIARADSLLGRLALDQGDHTGAETFFRRCLAIREEVGDQQGIGACWQHLADVRFDRRDYAGAEEYYRIALAIGERIGDQFAIADGWNGQALVARERGDLEAAADGFTRVLAIRERIGDQQGLAGAWNNLGAVAQLRRDLARADTCYRHALEIAERTGDDQDTAIAWYNLGCVAAGRGDPQATILCRRARLLARRIGFPSVEARAVLELARLRLRAGRFRHAEALLNHGAGLAAAYHLVRTGVAADLLAAELRLATGRPDEALALAQAARSHADAAGLRQEAAHVQQFLDRLD